MSKKSFKNKSTGRAVSRDSASVSTESAPLASAGPGGVPEGTESEAWRVMSAETSFALWKAERSATANPEAKDQNEAWQEEAPEYRIRVRAVLRSLEREGIKLRSAGADEILDPKSEPWRVYSARMAWLLWLKTRRNHVPPSLEDDLEAWKNVAADQRAIVRKVLEQLITKGIGFLSTE